MPGYRTHIVGGIVAYFSVILLIRHTNLGGLVPSTFVEQFVCIISAIFGSLAPDLDHPNSKIHEIMVHLTAIMAVPVVIPFIMGYRLDSLFYSYALGIAVFAIVPYFTRHRGFWHWWGGLLVGAGFLFLFSALSHIHYYPVLFAYFVGYLSHLTLDLL